MAYAPEKLISKRFLRNGNGDVASPNERSILRVLWQNPGVARSCINAQLDLTQQSIHRIVDHMVERGIVVLGAPVSGLSRGQPSPTLHLNGSYAYCWGMSINPDVIHICIMDLAGSILVQDAVALTGQSMAEALKEVSALMVQLRLRCKLEEDRLLGIGVGMTGYNIGGTRFNGPLPLHEWSLVELGPLLTEEFRKPVWIHIAGQTAAVAEAMFGIGRHIRHFAYLYIGYGFGGGLISDGELLLGGNGNAGEFACILDPTEIAKRPALKYLMNKLHANGIEIPTVEHLQKTFDPDWAGVAEWLDEVTPVFNRLVNAIWGVFGPQAIVLGGHVPQELGNMLIERMELYELPRYGVGHPPPKMIVSDVAGDAAAVGAASVPFKKLMF